VGIQASGGDRPLRHELRGRVDRYRERYEAQAVAEASKNFTTFNAFVRSEMRNGRLKLAVKMAVRNAQLCSCSRQLKAEAEERR